ncbi:hypothetical protein T01_8230 [Trichinella spiralis]|uniref:Uncharacterized protein n=1 Tax=Trichinella spiralis TaxID=6334 RepID=A0A0V1BH80_TRISP|nr:hypothetical protein T01_8230 [Trichinella spiralis]
MNDNRPGRSNRSIKYPVLRTTATPETARDHDSPWTALLMTTIPGWTTPQASSLISTIAAVHKVVFNGKPNLLQWRSFDPIHMLVIFKDHNNGR